MTDSIRTRHPVVAALLSLLLTGLGQFYNGQPRKAVAFFAVAMLPFILMATSSGFLLSVQGIVALYAGILVLLVIWLLSIADAFVVARKLGSIKLRRFNRWYVYIAVYLLIPIIPSIFDVSFEPPVAPYSVPSGSMKPSLLPGDYVFVDRNAYADESPQRGEVVVFKKPPENEFDYIMRVVGLPGDILQLEAGILHINGQAVEREKIADFINDSRDVLVPRGSALPQYIETLPGGKTHRILEIRGDTGFLDNMAAGIVPDGTYFVMGDNRDNAADSRTIGVIPSANLVGKAYILYFSISGDTPVWQVWKWPSEVRFDRIGQIVD